MITSLLLTVDGRPGGRTVEMVVDYFELYCLSPGVV